jgi:hypothetical protein
MKTLFTTIISMAMLSGVHGHPDDKLSASKACYKYGEDVVARFVNRAPEKDDWIALYSTSVESSDLGDPPVWFWLCEDEDACANGFGSFTFGEGAKSETGKPGLSPGTYKAVLARRNKGGPYSSYKESANIIIKAEGESCDGKAIPQPLLRGSGSS